jgi:hypothetical protein
MKKFTIAAFFPEVKPAHVAWQTVTVSAVRIDIAAHLGICEIRRRRELFGKHITEIRLTVTEVGMAPDGTRLSEKQNGCSRLEA